MVNRYRKKPVVVKAVQWTGDNVDDIYKFAGNLVTFTGCVGSFQLTINTLEGIMMASIGDYIIKGVNGEFYPCKPDIFNETYELINKGV